MLGKYFPFLAIAAVGYWYWSGPYQNGSEGNYAKQLAENEAAMERCVRREASMTTAAGMAGAPVGGGDAQSQCARELGLSLRDGQWHRTSVDEMGN